MPPSGADRWAGGIARVWGPPEHSRPSDRVGRPTWGSLRARRVGATTSRRTELRRANCARVRYRCRVPPATRQLRHAIGGPAGTGVRPAPARTTAPQSAPTGPSWSDEPLVVGLDAGRGVHPLIGVRPDGAFARLGTGAGGGVPGGPLGIAHVRGRRRLTDAASPVPVSSSCDSLTTPPSSSSDAGDHETGTTSSGGSQDCCRRTALLHLAVLPDTGRVRPAPAAHNLQDAAGGGHRQTCRCARRPGCAVAPTAAPARRHPRPGGRRRGIQRERLRGQRCRDRDVGWVGEGMNRAL
jgi:hypothetical protein